MVRGIEVITDWTSDKAAVLAAIDTAAGRPGLGNLRQAERKEQGVALDPSDLERSAADGGDRYRLDTEERIYAEMLASQLEGTVGAATAAMRGLDVIPRSQGPGAALGGWPR